MIWVPTPRCFLTVDVMWTAASHPCHRAFPTVTDCPLDLRTKTNLASWMASIRYFAMVMNKVTASMGEKTKARPGNDSLMKIPERIERSGQLRETLYGRNKTRLRKLTKILKTEASKGDNSPSLSVEMRWWVFQPQSTLSHFLLYLRNRTRSRALPVSCP